MIAGSADARLIVPPLPGNANVIVSAPAEPFAEVIAARSVFAPSQPMR